jgi:hypothetical protein
VIQAVKRDSEGMIVPTTIEMTSDFESPLPLLPPPPVTSPFPVLAVEFVGTYVEVVGMVDSIVVVVEGATLDVEPASHQRRHRRNTPTKPSKLAAKRTNRRSLEVEAVRTDRDDGVITVSVAKLLVVTVIVKGAFGSPDGAAEVAYAVTVAGAVNVQYRS